MSNNFSLLVSVDGLLTVIWSNKWGDSVFIRAHTVTLALEQFVLLDDWWDVDDTLDEPGGSIVSVGGVVNIEELIEHVQVFVEVAHLVEDCKVQNHVYWLLDGVLEPLVGA